MAQNDERTHKLREIADSAILMLISRAAVPIICGLCIWILTSVSTMKENMAAAMATIAGHDKRIENLEEWRNSFDAMADEGRHR
jgi:hypothetical protein